jgi:hypothetical protein
MIPGVASGEEMQNAGQRSERKIECRAVQRRRELRWRILPNRADLSQF